MSHNLYDKLAELEFKKWSNWLNILFNQCIQQEDGSLVIPSEYVTYWKKIIKVTEYVVLDVSTKDIFLNEAKNILNILHLYMPQITSFLLYDKEK